ncbi:MAG: transglycosylase SLT domain-containing protein [Rickettsiales bacterium]
MVRLFLAALFFLYPPLIYSLDYKEYIFLHNSNQCNNYFSHIEEKHSIPEHLLRSISVAETGRWHKDAQLYFTWPWTVNQEGKSYYFNTKDEAIKEVRRMLEKGHTNIDIGCMQINLHHHPEAFLNLNQAFDPKENIEYAAIFLKKNYILANDWNKAIALYHSQKAVGKLYADKVTKIYNDYINNVLSVNFCTSTTGKTSSCTAYNSLNKEKLSLLATNDTKNGIVSPNIKMHKNNKRLKSNIISYSTNN